MNILALRNNCESPAVQLWLFPWKRSPPGNQVILALRELLSSSGYHERGFYLATGQLCTLACTKDSPPLQRQGPGVQLECLYSMSRVLSEPNHHRRRAIKVKQKNHERVKFTWQQVSCAFLHVLKEIQDCNVRVQASNSSACTPWVLSEPNHLHQHRAIKSKHLHLISIPPLLLLARPKYLMLWFIICTLSLWVKPGLCNVQSLTENYNNSLYIYFLILGFFVSSGHKVKERVCKGTRCVQETTVFYSHSLGNSRVVVMAVWGYFYRRYTIVSD